MKIKEIIKGWGAPVLLALSIVGGILMTTMVAMHIFIPAYNTNGTVTAVGYKGITVEYVGDHGQSVTKQLDVDNVTDYAVGDTVAVEIKPVGVAVTTDIKPVNI